MCKEPVRHKLPQTISSIDIDSIVREFDISQYFKGWKKICCKRHSFQLIYAHYENWMAHSDRMKSVLSFFIVHWQDFQTTYLDVFFNSVTYALEKIPVDVHKAKASSSKKFVIRTRFCHHIYRKKSVPVESLSHPQIPSII